MDSGPDMDDDGHEEVGGGEPEPPPPGESGSETDHASADPDHHRSVKRQEYHESPYRQIANSGSQEVFHEDSEFAMDDTGWEDGYEDSGFTSYPSVPGIQPPRSHMSGPGMRGDDPYQGGDGFGGRGRGRGRGKGKGLRGRPPFMRGGYHPHEYMNTYDYMYQYPPDMYGDYSSNYMNGPHQDYAGHYPGFSGYSGYPDQQGVSQQVDSPALRIPSDKQSEASVEPPLDPPLPMDNIPLPEDIPIPPPGPPLPQEPPQELKRREENNSEKVPPSQDQVERIPSPVERNEDVTPAVTMPSKLALPVLGKEQAKKRLMAFQWAKQANAAAASSTKSSDPSEPAVPAQDDDAAVIPSNMPSTSTLDESKKKKPKGGTRDNQLRATVASIEEMKRQELSLLKARSFNRNFVEMEFSPIAPLLDEVTNPLLASIIPKDEKGYKDRKVADAIARINKDGDKHSRDKRNRRRSRSRSRERRRHKDRHREKEKEKGRDRDREKEKKKEKEKEKEKKKECMPQSWSDFSSMGIKTYDDFRILRAKLEDRERSERSMQRDHDRHEHHRRRDRDHGRKRSKSKSRDKDHVKEKENSQDDGANAEVDSKEEDKDLEKDSREKLEKDDKDDKKESRRNEKSDKASIFDLPSRKLVPMVVTSDKLDRVYPESKLRYTKTKPRLVYCGNPDVVTARFDTRQEILDRAPEDILHILDFFLLGKRRCRKKNKESLCAKDSLKPGLAALQESYDVYENEDADSVPEDFTEASQNWFPKSDYLLPHYNDKEEEYEIIDILSSCDIKQELNEETSDKKPSESNQLDLDNQGKGQDSKSCKETYGKPLIVIKPEGTTVRSKWDSDYENEDEDKTLRVSDKKKPGAADPVQASSNAVEIPDESWKDSQNEFDENEKGNIEISSEKKDEQGESSEPVGDRKERPPLISEKREMLKGCDERRTSGKDQSCDEEFENNDGIKIEEMSSGKQEWRDDNEHEWVQKDREKRNEFKEPIKERRKKRDKRVSSREESRYNDESDQNVRRKVEESTVSLERKKDWSDDSSEHVWEHKEREKRNDFKEPVKEVDDKRKRKSKPSTSREASRYEDESDENDRRKMEDNAVSSERKKDWSDDSFEHVWDHKERLEKKSDFKEPVKESGERRKKRDKRTSSREEPRHDNETDEGDKQKLEDRNVSIERKEWSDDSCEWDRKEKPEKKSDQNPIGKVEEIQYKPDVRTCSIKEVGAKEEQGDKVELEKEKARGPEVHRSRWDRRTKTVEDKTKVSKSTRSWSFLDDDNADVESQKQSLNGKGTAKIESGNDVTSKDHLIDNYKVLHFKSKPKNSNKLASNTSENSGEVLASEYEEFMKIVSVGNDGSIPDATAELERKQESGSDLDLQRVEHKQIKDKEWEEYEVHSKSKREREPSMELEGKVSGQGSQASSVSDSSSKLPPVGKAELPSSELENVLIDTGKQPLPMSIQEVDREMTRLKEKIGAEENSKASATTKKRKADSPSLGTNSSSSESEKEDLPLKKRKKKKSIRIKKKQKRSVSVSSSSSSDSDSESSGDDGENVKKKKNKKKKQKSKKPVTRKKDEKNEKRSVKKDKESARDGEGKLDKKKRKKGKSDDFDGKKAKDKLREKDKKAKKKRKRRKGKESMSSSTSDSDDDSSSEDKKKKKRKKKEKKKKKKHQRSSSSSSSTSSSDDTSSDSNSNSESDSELGAESSSSQDEPKKKSRKRKDGQKKRRRNSESRDKSKSKVVSKEVKEGKKEKKLKQQLLKKSNFSEDEDAKAKKREKAWDSDDSKTDDDFKKEEKKRKHDDSDDGASKSKKDKKDRKLKMRKEKENKKQKKKGSKGRSHDESDEDDNEDDEDDDEEEDEEGDSQDDELKKVIDNEELENYFEESSLRESKEKSGFESPKSPWDSSEETPNISAKGIRPIINSEPYSPGHSDEDDELESQFLKSQNVVKPIPRVRQMHIDELVPLYQKKPEDLIKHMKKREESDNYDVDNMSIASSDSPLLADNLTIAPYLSGLGDIPLPPSSNAGSSVDSGQAASGWESGWELPSPVPPPVPPPHIPYPSSGFSIPPPVLSVVPPPVPPTSDSPSSKISFGTVKSRAPISVKLQGNSRFQATPLPLFKEEVVQRPKLFSELIPLNDIVKDTIEKGKLSTESSKPEGRWKSIGEGDAIKDKPILEGIVSIVPGRRREEEPKKKKRSRWGEKPTTEESSEADNSETSFEYPSTQPERDERKTLCSLPDVEHPVEAVAATTVDPNEMFLAARVPVTPLRATTATAISPAVPSPAVPLPPPPTTHSRSPSEEAPETSISTRFSGISPVMNDSLQLLPIQETAGEINAYSDQVTSFDEVAFDDKTEDALYADIASYDEELRTPPYRLEEHYEKKKDRSRERDRTRDRDRGRDYERTRKDRREDDKPRRRRSRSTERRKRRSRSRDRDRERDRERDHRRRIDRSRDSSVDRSGDRPGDKDRDRRRRRDRSEEKRRRETPEKRRRRRLTPSSESEASNIEGAVPLTRIKVEKDDGMIIPSSCPPSTASPITIKLEKEDNYPVVPSKPITFGSSGSASNPVEVLTDQDQEARQEQEQRAQQSRPSEDREKDPPHRERWSEAHEFGGNNSPVFRLSVADSTISDADLAKEGTASVASATAPVASATAPVASATAPVASATATAPVASATATAPVASATAASRSSYRDRHYENRESIREERPEYEEEEEAEEELSPPSPKRLSLDDRIELELGVKHTPPPTAHHGVPPLSVPPSLGAPPLGIPPLGMPPPMGVPPPGVPPIGVPPPGVPPPGVPPPGVPPPGVPQYMYQSYPGYSFTSYPPPNSSQSAPANVSRVVQVGNMLQVVPVETPSPVMAPPIPHPQLAHHTNHLQRTQQHVPHQAQSAQNKVVQSGNMLKIIPVSDSAPSSTVVQVGNMIQVVPSAAPTVPATVSPKKTTTPPSTPATPAPVPVPVPVPVPAPLKAPPVAPSSAPQSSLAAAAAAVAAAIAANSPAESAKDVVGDIRSTPPVQSSRSITELPFLPPDLIAAMEEEQHARKRKERKLRRQQREERRREKERRRSLKIQRAAESIKKALIQEGQLQRSDFDLEEMRLIEEAMGNTDMVEGDEADDAVAAAVGSQEEDDSSRKRKKMPPLPPAGKGILISPGFRERPLFGEDNSSESGPSHPKEVKFADGVKPGEGTSPSGGEDLPSPPPPDKMPKEKRLKKKKQKKKIKVQVIRQVTVEDDDDDDDGSPPPPPPGSPPPVTAFPHGPYSGFTASAAGFVYGPPGYPVLPTGAPALYAQYPLAPPPSQASLVPPSIKK